MNERIVLSLPHMGGTEQKYIDEAFETNWILPLGPHVNEFERRLQQYLAPDKHVVALSAGTAAIHLGLLMAGVQPGDEVICQSLTFSASANPIVYLGARPVFVDSEEQSMNMDPVLLEEAIVDRKRRTGRYPKAIVPVHLYGMPANMEKIMEISRRYNIPVVEDAAEALGSKYKGQPCGTFGLYGILSFNGNKIITTSGGGALICPDSESADRVKFLSTQAREDRPYYYHTTIGYNYRLSNVSGAIGCGQMEVLDKRVERRRQIHSIYTEMLDGYKGIRVQQEPGDDYYSNFWLTTLQVEPQGNRTADSIRLALAAENIESRLLWRPMHMQPVFAECPYYGGKTSEKLFENGLCLASGSILTDEQIERVWQAVKKV